MLKKVVKILSGCLLAFGFILMIGTVGASDAGAIGFNTLAIRGGISVVLMASGFFGLKFTGCDFIY